MITGTIYIKRRKISCNGNYGYFETVKEIKYGSLVQRKNLIRHLCTAYNVNNDNVVLSVIPKL